MNNVASVMQRYLQNSGMNVSYMNYGTKIQEFLDWYRGKTKFHKYQVYNGSKTIGCERVSLCMAKTVCEDFASLLLNEKCAMKLSDEISQKYIDECTENNMFREQANKLIELTEALGTGAFVEGVDEKGQPVIDYIQGDMIFPLEWDNGKITECAFVKIGGDEDNQEYTVIEHRKAEDGTYIIKTTLVDGEGEVVKPLEMVAEYGNSESDEYRTNSKYPWFQVFTTNIVNNYDKTSPLGMSCFGNAIDILKSIDVIYDSWHNEFVLGKKRIFVKSDLKSVKIAVGDEITNQVDENDVVFYQIEWTENEKPPIYESNMALRVGEHIEAMDKQLNLLSRKVGLGDNFYSFTGGSLGRTATEIISANSALFRNIKKQELPLTRALKGMVKALLFIGGYNTEQDITIDYDDSIIEDTQKIRENAMAEFNAGLIDKIEYFAITKKMTRQQAEQYVKTMEESNTLKEYGGMIEDMGFGINGVGE